MLRGIIGVSRRDHMRTDEIRRILHVSPIDEVMRGGRLRWFGHVQIRDADNVTRNVIRRVNLWPKKHLTQKKLIQKVFLMDFCSFDHA